MKVPMARRFLAGFMAVLMAWSSASSYVDERSYWKGRRQAVQSRGKTVHRSDIQLAALGAMALPPDGLISSGYSLDVLSESQISFPVQSPPNATKKASDAVPESVLKILRALPVNVGTVRAISMPRCSIQGVVIHILDIHENGEAQANISRTVRGLLESKAIDVVGLEGAFAPLDLENYRRFPHRETLRLVADDLLARHVISGSVHAGFLSGGSTVPFLGVDQEVHHRRNVDAYRDSLIIQGEDQRVLNQAARLLEVKKEAHFSQALRRFDRALHDYRAGKTGLAQHVETLATLAPRLPPQARIFHEAIKLEKHLDFARAERERAKVVERLVQSLSEKEISDLTVRSAEFRTGRLSRGAFYGFLKHLCKISGLTLETYPAFNEYLTYVLHAQNIRMDHLQMELTQLGQEISRRLARTTVEKDLLEESDRLYVLSSLTQFTLSPNEWEQYKAMDPSNLLPPSHRTLYESFYREAEIRDDEMSNGLLDALKTRKIHSAVLVAGGFHGSGIQRRLTQQGMAVVEYVPKITKVAEGNGSAYLSVFAQEKTPLEQLFTAENLFVAKEPMANTTRFQVAGEVSAVEGTSSTGMKLDEVERAFLSQRFIERIKRTTHVFKDGISRTVFYFPKRAWVFTYSRRNGKQEFSQGPLNRKKIRLGQMMRKAMSFGVLACGAVLGHTAGLALEITGGPLSEDVDPRPTKAGLLKEPFVRYFMAVRHTMNPNFTAFRKGVYAGSGLDISSFLLATDCDDSYFVTSSPELNIDVVKQLPAFHSNESHWWHLEKYKTQKSNVGVSGSSSFELATEDQILNLLALELESLGVDLKRITVDLNEGHIRIRFPWTYWGKREKSYSITFIPINIGDPNGYPPLLKNMKAVDVFMVKAGFFIPLLFEQILPWWAEHMSNGAFFATDDHAVPIDVLRGGSDKKIRVPFPLLEGITEVPIPGAAALLTNILDVKEAFWTDDPQIEEPFDRESPDAVYGIKLTLRRLSKDGPPKNKTMGENSPNTLEWFWTAWNKIRNKQVSDSDMVTHQAPWESYWVAVLAGVTGPILTAFGLSPLWAGMWGAAWGFAHAAGTFDRDLNKIRGRKAFPPSLSRAVGGLIWVTLYAWGLDALLSQLPLTEYLARFAVFERWGISFGLLLPSNMIVSLFVALLISSQIVGPLARLVHSQLNKRGDIIPLSFVRDRPVLAFSGVISLLSLFVLVEFVGLSVLLTVFQAAVTAVFLGNLIFSLYFLWLSHKHQQIAPPPKKQFQTLPTVTIQLPMFNEANVAERIIRSAADVDYPKDKLEIQVLDDSTDETIHLVENIVNELREEGKNVVLVHRTNRGGYKAGALKEGMRTAQGEFIAIFDADFVVPKDFLMKTIHHFTDEKVAMVEGRWGHLNRNFSFLTQAQATWLDAHMFIEQGAKNQEGLWVHFHGTGGVWRKSAIEDAGGWLERTVTEDGDLSYRALLKDWKMVYLRDYASPAELPPTMQAYLAQQYRWHKGGVQVLKFLLGDLLKSRYSPKIKLTALHRLTNPFLSPVSLFSILLLPFIYAYGLNLDLINLWWGLLWFIMTPAWLLIEIITYRDARLNVEGEAWRGQPFLKRWSLLSIGIMLNVGTIVHKSWAVVDAIFGKSLVFVRTPKYNSVEGNLVSQKRVSYKPERIKTLELLTLGAALYTFIGSLYFGLQGVYAPALFFFFNGISFTWIGLTPFLEGRQARKQDEFLSPAQTPLALRIWAWLVQFFSIRKNHPPRAFLAANVLGKILPWPWITWIVRTGRVEALLDSGMPQFLAEVVYYLGRDTGLIYRSYMRPGRLAPVDDLMCYLGVKRTDGPSLLFDIGPGFPPITPNEMAQKTGARVVTFETGQPRYLVTLGTSEHGQSPLYARFNENQELLSVWRYGGQGGTSFVHYLRVREMLKKYVQNNQQPKGGDIRIDPTRLGLNPKTNLDRREGNLFSELQVFPGEKADAIRIANVLWFQDKKKELAAIHKLNKYLHPGGKIYIVDGGAEQMEVMVFENMKDGLLPRFYGMTCLPGTEFRFNENLGTDRHGGRGWLFGPFEKHRQAVSAITSTLAQSSQWSPDSVVVELQKEFPGVTHVGNLYLFPMGGMFELEGSKQVNHGMDENRLVAMDNLMSDLDQHSLASLGVGEKFVSPESVGWAVANSLADQVRQPSFVQGLRDALAARGVKASNIKSVRAFFASLIPYRAHLFFISRSAELTEDQWQSFSRTLRSRYKPGEALIVVPQGMDEPLVQTLRRFDLTRYVERAPSDAFLRSPGGGTWVLPLVERGTKLKKILAQQPLVTLYAGPGVSFDRAGVVSDNLAEAAQDVKRLLDALESLPLLRTRSEIIGILTRAVQESA